MGTSNFYPHENGIFVIEGATKEVARESIIEGLKDVYNDKEELQEEIDGITDEQIYNEMNFLDEMMIEDYMEFLVDGLPYGMYGDIKSSTEATIYNKQGKLIAELTLRSGYYSDAQIIVETDPEELLGDYYPETQTELYEEYTPHNKRLLDYIAKCTTPIKRVGRFSDGTSIYERI